MKIGSALGFLIWGSVLGVMGYFFYSMLDNQRTERELRAQVARLSQDERVARFYVEKIVRDLDSGSRTVHVRWQEQPKGGKGSKGSMPVRELAVNGDEIWFQIKQIVFDKGHIREGDPLRGKSLYLFHRIYGLEKGADGKLKIPDENGEVMLETPPMEPGRIEAQKAAIEDAEVPPYYRRRGAGATAARLETQLWRDIWRLYRDQQFASSQGVSSAHKIAISKPLVEGKEYHLTLSASGQLTMPGPFEPDPLHVLKQKP